MKQPTESEMLARAAAYCSTAERCRQDVEKKIIAAGLPSEIAERILERLVKEGFINEARYCRSFVNDKLRFNKWGRIRIGHELRMKNIPPALYYEALDTIDDELYAEILRGILKEKKKSIKARDKRDEFSKLFRFAAGRGFESELIMRSLRESGTNEDSYPEDMD